MKFRLNIRTFPRVIGRDLIDDDNGYCNSAGNHVNCLLQDDVSGFTMHDVFYSLQGAHASSTNGALEKWRDNLKARRPAQGTNLDNYFSLNKL